MSEFFDLLSAARAERRLEQDEMFAKRLEAADRELAAEEDRLRKRVETSDRELAEKLAKEEEDGLPATTTTTTPGASAPAVAKSTGPKPLGELPAGASNIPAAAPAPRAPSKKGVAVATAATTATESFGKPLRRVGRKKFTRSPSEILRMWEKPEIIARESDSGIIILGHLPVLLSVSIRLLKTENIILVRATPDSAEIAHQFAKSKKDPPAVDMHLDLRITGKLNVIQPEDVETEYDDSTQMLKVFVRNACLKQTNRGLVHKVKSGIKRLFRSKPASESSHA